MVIKVIEIMASSPNSWEEAAKNAVVEVKKTVRDIKSIYVKDMSAEVRDGEITEYRITSKISFAVHS